MREGVLIAIALAFMACAPRLEKRVIRYPNGTLKAEIETANGVPHGVSRWYHENGELASLGEYERGERHGRSEYRDEQGDLVRAAVFVHGERKWSSTNPEETPPASLARVAPQSLAEVPDTDVEPVYGTLERSGRSDQLRVQVGIHPDRDDATGIRPDLYGQVMRGSVGGYTALTASLHDDRRGKAAVEAGGAYLVRKGRLNLLGTAGLAAPLLFDDAEGFGVTASTGGERVADAVLTYPKAIALRSAASVIGADGAFFYRIDVALDAAFSVADANNAVQMKDSLELLGRAGLAVGLGSRRLAFSVELANAALLTEGLGAAHSLGLNVRFRSWVAQPYATVVFPFASGNEGAPLIFAAGMTYQGAR